MICTSCTRKVFSLLMAAMLYFTFLPGSVLAGPGEDTDQQVKTLALQCRTEIIARLEAMLSGGRLTMAQLFDTFYIPIANTSPQKYHTQYDTLFDEVLPGILDKYMARNHKINFVVAVDRNGYVPTHNTRSLDRAKRLFNDRTGLAAARNKESYLFQKYERDTGTAIYDLSVPVFIRNRHWGAIRFGYTP